MSTNSERIDTFFDIYIMYLLPNTDGVKSIFFSDSIIFFSVHIDLIFAAAYRTQYYVINQIIFYAQDLNLPISTSELVIIMFSLLNIITW